MALIPLRQALASSGSQSQSGLVPLRQALASRTPQAPPPAMTVTRQPTPTPLDVRPGDNATRLNQAGNVLSLAGTANSLVGGPTDLSGIATAGAGAARIAGDITTPNLSPVERALRVGQDVTGVVGGLANVSGVQSLVPGLADAARSTIAVPGLGNLSVLGGLGTAAGVGADIAGDAPDAIKGLKAGLKVGQYLSGPLLNSLVLPGAGTASVATPLVADAAAGYTLGGAPEVLGGAAGGGALAAGIGAVAIPILTTIAGQILKKTAHVPHEVRERQDLFRQSGWMAGYRGTIGLAETPDEMWSAMAARQSGSVGGGQPLAQTTFLNNVPDEFITWPPEARKQALLAGQGGNAPPVPGNPNPFYPVVTKANFKKLIASGWQPDFGASIQMGVAADKLAGPNAALTQALNRAGARVALFEHVRPAYDAYVRQYGTTYGQLRPPDIETFTRGFLAAGEAATNPAALHAAVQQATTERVYQNLVAGDPLTRNLVMGERTPLPLDLWPQLATVPATGPLTWDQRVARWQWEGARTGENPVGDIDNLLVQTPWMNQRGELLAPEAVAAFRQGSNLQDPASLGRAFQSVLSQYAPSRSLVPPSNINMAELAGMPGGA